MMNTTSTRSRQNHHPDKRVTLDFETRSRADLKKVGAYKYSLHPSTQPTCLSFKARGAEIQLLNFYQINTPWSSQPERFRNAWLYFIEGDFLFTAHNAFFERCIYTNIMVKRYGWPKIPFRNYRCTAAKAAACALPRNLEGVGSALNLRIQKDRRGYVAMMATCRPNKKTGDFISPQSHPEVFETLYTYCRIDTQTEELLDETLPDLSLEEQDIWHLNQELNWRGLRIDIPVVKKILGIMEIESRKKLKELDHLTMGLVTKPGSRKSILEFLELEGVVLPDLRAQTVEDRLQGFELSEDMRRLLEIRKALSKTSTKKYQAFLDRADETDHRVRDILMYHGASTGRDTGTGVQPHNLPRPLIKQKDIDYVISMLREERPEISVEWIKIFYGDIFMIFSSLLRGMLIASEGYELFVADFSKIEVAVLWWLAGNFPGLKILRLGKDPYIYQAAMNLNTTYEDIEDVVKREEQWGLDARQLGKAQVLGCGFQMGVERFQTAAWDMHRLKLTETQAQAAVTNYRSGNPAVPLLWKAFEKAAVEAVKNPGQVFHAGKCAFSMRRKFLWVRLPSGRKLAYREPQVTWVETKYGPKETLEYYAVNPKTKQWGIERTFGGKLTENIVQAVARDLMMPAMVRLRQHGYRPLLMVHDEGICEKEKGTGDIQEFVKILCEPPKWAAGCPIDAKGWSGPRYRK